METGFEIQLLEGASAGVYQIVKTCLDLGTEIETKDEYGNTALNLSALGGHLEIVKFLVEQGADTKNKGGAELTPLKIAATSGFVDISKYLIAKGAKIDYDLLSIIQMKLNILKENAETGMILQGGVESWESFLEFLVREFNRQNEQE